MSFLPLEMLRSGAYELGIELTDNQLTRLDEFASLVVEANRELNLTRIVEPEAIVTSHYLDSLTCLAALEPPPGASVIDVGTGAGFPGVPIKIARPDLAMTLLDATRKKIDFLGSALGRIGIGDVALIHGRAEEIGRDPCHRERYDAACARALSGMTVIAELCLPLVRLGGRVIAQKSSEIDQEVGEARPMIEKLGGTLERIVRTRIPHTEIDRQLVVIVKVRPCPREFPRPYSRIVRGKG